MKTLCTYLLPIRRSHPCAAESAGFARYFELLTRAGCEVLVIDGSQPDIFAKADAGWRDACRHLPVNRRFTYLNDKVNAIHTGVALAGSNKIILADDDIRYSPSQIADIAILLDHCDVVRPQNFLRPLPWWAKIEAARMLVNRALLRTADYPGTCAFRRNVMLRAGHYDGDVLFDNEELIRHLANSGALIRFELDFLVERRAPRFRKWLEQRPRQAYEDFDLRAKTSLFLTLLPLGVLVVLFFGIRALLAYFGLVATGVTGLAILGFSRGNASKGFSLTICLYAPLWILERSISTYVAACWWLFRGGYPFGEKTLTKGIGRDWKSGGRLIAQQYAKQRTRS